MEKTALVSSSGGSDMNLAVAVVALPSSTISTRTGTPGGVASDHRTDSSADDGMRIKIICKDGRLCICGLMN